MKSLCIDCGLVHETTVYLRPCVVALKEALADARKNNENHWATRADIGDINNRLDNIIDEGLGHIRGMLSNIKTQVEQQANLKKTVPDDVNVSYWQNRCVAAENLAEKFRVRLEVIGHALES